MSNTSSTAQAGDTVPDRAALVAIARSWIGTPYRRRAMVKGAGADCATLLLGALRESGLVSLADASDELRRVFADDWFLHARDEEYKLRVLRHAEQLCECVAYRSSNFDSGNILLIKTAGSRRYNHAGMVTAWPRVVHAIAPCVEECDASRHPMWINKTVAVFDPFICSATPR